MREISKDQNDMHRYDDMLDHAHHVSSYHHPMPVENRAAQFKPFAALNGYDEAIVETARTTDEKRELSEEQKAVLDAVLSEAEERLPEHPEVLVLVFHKDEKKQGGREQWQRMRLKSIDPVNRILKGEDRTSIAMDDIMEMKLITKE